MLFHVLNRGVGRMELFSREEDYAAFKSLMEQKGKGGWMPSTLFLESLGVSIFLPLASLQRSPHLWHVS